jgi:molybdate transport system substrate-binding protein
MVAPFLGAVVMATLRTISVIVVFMAPGCRRTEPITESVDVLAAASLAEVLQDAAEEFESQTGSPVRCSFAASSTLARQIEHGAPWDLFISANRRWVEHLVARQHVKPTSCTTLLINRLVWIIPRTAPPYAVEWTSPPTPQMLAGPIAIADPEHVPAGLYARQALVALEWWPAIRSRIVPAANVRAAMRLVETAQADAGIVYHSDARSSQDVKALTTVPKQLHDPITYEAALPNESSDVAQAFLEFLRGPWCRQRFESQGFTIPSATEIAP